MKDVSRRRFLFGEISIYENCEWQEANQYSVIPAGTGATGFAAVVFKTHYQFWSTHVNCHGKLPVEELVGLIHRITATIATEAYPATLMSEEQHRDRLQWCSMLVLLLFNCVGSWNLCTVK
jgi:hypothetical protein